ncbi:MAG: hypothetical protein KDE27_12620 [Planctomycetes bacterium]|nr:hypothetical protein [Planctomycetota bacterium]
MSRSQSRRLPSALLATVIAAIGAIVWLARDRSAPPADSPPGETVAEARTTPSSTATTTPAGDVASPDRVFAAPSEDARGRLLLQDATTADAIAGIRVEITYADDRRAVRTSDAAGEIPLSPAAGTRITIQADGYVRLDARLDEVAAAEAEHALRIGLQPAGALELRFGVDRPERSEAAEVVLLPPCPRLGDWGEDWRRIVPLAENLANDDGVELRRRGDGVWLAAAQPRPAVHRLVAGVARIEGLPPGPDYRWALWRGGPALMNPPFERPALAENADGQARIASSEPEHLSGPFAIRAAETTAFDVRLLPTASIRGVFPVAGCEVPPQVKLYRLETLQPSNGPAVCRSQDLAFVVASAEGGFRFDGLAPGTYAVRAWWRTARVVQFCSAACVLASEDVDFGEIDVVSGDSVFVRLDLRERDTGCTLSPAEALPEIERPLGAVMVQSVPDSRLAHEQVFEALPVEFETTYELRGFRPGTLSLEPRVPPWLLAGSVTNDLAATPGVHTRLEPDSQHRLHLEVERRLAWLLELPAEFLGRPFEVWSRRALDGEVRRLEVRGPRGLDDLPYLHVLAPRCDQELFFRELDEPHRFAFATVHEPPRVSSLQPIFASREPLPVACPAIAPGDVAGWTLRGWDTSTPIWSARVGADGAAVLQGVPQQRELEGLANAPDVPARR